MIAVRTISVYYMLSAIGVEGWNPTAPIVSAASVGDEHGVSRKQISRSIFRCSDLETSIRQLLRFALRRQLRLYESSPLK